MTLEQNYQDIVAGAIAWADYSKTRDFVGALISTAVFLAVIWGAAYGVEKSLTKKARHRLVSPHPWAPFAGWAAGILVALVLHWRLAAPLALEVPVLALVVAFAIGRLRLDPKLIAKLRPLQVGCPLLLFATVQIGFRFQEASESFGPNEQGWIFLSAAIAGLMVLSARTLKRDPKCVVAWPTFFTLGTLSAYTLPAWSPLLLDDFHLGELYTAWHQIHEKGARPYVDFVPVQGLLGMVAGYWNQWIYGGDLGTYLIAKASVESQVGGLCLVLAARVLGPRLAGWMLPVLAIYPEGGDRLLCLLPFTLLILDPWLVARPSVRGPTWAALALFAILYNLPSGVAWTVSTGIALAATLYLTRPRWNFRQLAAGVAAVLAFIGVSWNWLVGVVTFGLANGRANSVAYGLGVVQPDTTHSLPIDWDHPAYRLSIEAMRSGGWLLSMALGGIFLVMAARARKKAERSFPPLFLVGCLSLLGPLLLLPYSFGRIAAIGLSRTGVTSLVFLGSLSLVGCLIALSRRPFSLLWSGLTGVALGYALPLSMWAPRAKLADLFTPVSVPREFVLVRGTDWGLPKLGAVFTPPDRWRELITIRDRIRNSKAPEENYLDLTNRSLLYALLDERVPVPLASDYHAFDEGFQNRNLSALKKSPPALVWLAPSIRHLEGPASIRNYRVYRWLLESDLYSLTVHKPFAALVHKEKNPNARISGPMDAKELEVLNGILQPIDLQRLPHAWGRNWPRLENRFERRATTIVASEKGHWRVTSGALDGATGRADFLRLEIPGDPRAPWGSGRLHWTSVDGSSGSFNFEWKPGRFLLPLGTAPRWLVGSPITEVEVILNDGAAALASAEFQRLTR